MTVTSGERIIGGSAWGLSVAFAAVALCPEVGNQEDSPTPESNGEGPPVGTQRAGEEGEEAEKAVREEQVDGA
eukprot:7041943-Pyramimonas_sp.AAC.1